MSSGLIAQLIRQNLPHLLGIIIYGFIGISLALLCYKLFTSFFIPLKSGMEFTPQESLASAILAAGIVVGMSILVAVTAYEPPLVHVNSAPRPASAAVASTGCGGAKPKTVKKAKLDTGQVVSSVQEVAVSGQAKN